MCDGFYEETNVAKPYTGYKKKPPPTKPIVSYGVILFTRKNGRLRYLLYQRRDTYEYIDMLRGMWNTTDRLRELCTTISEEERERIRNHTFRELWDDLWVTHNVSIHLHGYEKAFKKFESYRDKIIEYINLPAAGGVQILDAPWGFPKGKKNDREADVTCALREFREETGMPSESLRVWDMKPYIEAYRGNNNKPYCIYYYLAESPGEMPVEKHETPGCIRPYAVSEEAADVKWFDFEDAYKLLDPRKAELLQRADYLIRSRS